MKRVPVLLQSQLFYLLTACSPLSREYCLRFAELASLPQGASAFEQINPKVVACELEVEASFEKFTVILGAGMSSLGYKILSHQISEWGSLVHLSVHSWDEKSWSRWLQGMLHHSESLPVTMDSTFWKATVKYLCKYLIKPFNPYSSPKESHVGWQHHIAPSLFTERADHGQG